MRTFLILLIFLPLVVNAQSFAPIGSKWHYTNIEDFFSSSQGYVTLESVGDTLIQGLDCRILDETEYRTSGDTIHKRFEYIHVEGDTVWRYADDDSFYILYDFSADIGDTWTTKAFSVMHGGDLELEVQVDSITTTTINGQELKSMYCSTGGSELSFGLGPVTEIIGGTWFMFPFNYSWQDGDIRIALRCYSDPTFGSYITDSSIECDDLITDLSEIDPVNPIELYPNPSSGKVTIQWDQASMQIDQLDVYASDGKLIRTVAPAPISGTYELHSLNKGVYFITLTGAEHQITKKFVIN